MAELTALNGAQVWFSQELLGILKIQMHMSDSTWQKLIASDPEGWREMLDGRTDES